MPFHADTPYFVHRMREANRIMNFAMRREPEEYFDTIERPGLLELPEEAGNFTAAEYSHAFDAESEAVDLFKAGIQDVLPPFYAVLDVKPELTQPEAQALMVHDQTIATYGLLASMPQDALGRVYEHAATHFTLSEGDEAITLARPVRSSPHFGCEAVDTRGDSLKMSPTFKKFVAWAGQLTVLSYFEDAA